MSLKHGFVSSLSDGSTPGEIQPSHWGSDDTDYSNDPTHVFSGGALGSVLYRDTGQADGKNWLTPAAAGVLGWTGAGVAPTVTTAPTITGGNITELNASNLSTGSIPDARVPASAVTQHLTGYARIGTAETITAAWVFSGIANTGLKVLDTNASHALSLVPGSDLTAARALTLTTGDADRTITLSGNPTLGDWFDQSVKAAASPTFAGVVLADGSAATPALRFTNYATTGLFAEAGPILNVAIGGTARWQWNASGHLLAVADDTYDIGTSSGNRPRTANVATSVVIGGATPLTITSNSLMTSAANVVILGNSGARSIHFRTTNITRVAVDSGSNAMAIGTTTGSTGMANSSGTSGTLQGINGSGADNAGSDLILGQGRGTGSGAPGNLYIAVAPASGSSSTLNTHVNAYQVGASGHFLGITATRAFGYGTGAGGAVTQATSKATGVTLNTVTGEITLNNAALNAATNVSFTFTNSVIAVGDLVLVQHVSGGTLGGYYVTAVPAGAGSATVTVRNITAGSLSEAPVIKYVVIKAATA